MISTPHTIARVILLVLVTQLTGCLGSIYDRVTAPDDAVPKKEAPSKRGNMPSYEVFGKRYYTLKSSKGYVERGIASWYGPKFHGKTTSNGETYDMHGMTAAHTRLPLPTFVRVTNLENGRSTVVRINDRGPFKKNRVIDLSYAAAQKLGIIAKGTGLVEVRAVEAGAADTPASMPKPIKGNIYIQVGAYGNPLNADQMKERLSRELGEPVRISLAESNGRTLYRVQAGPVRDVDASDRLAARIADLGMNSYVVID